MTYSLYSVYPGSFPFGDKPLFIHHQVDNSIKYYVQSSWPLCLIKAYSLKSSQTPVSSTLNFFRRQISSHLKQPLNQVWGIEFLDELSPQLFSHLSFISSDLGNSHQERNGWKEDWCCCQNQNRKGPGLGAGASAQIFWLTWENHFSPEQEVGHEAIPHITGGCEA